MSDTPTNPAAAALAAIQQRVAQAAGQSTPQAPTPPPQASVPSLRATPSYLQPGSQPPSIVESKSFLKLPQFPGPKTVRTRCVGYDYEATHEFRDKDGQPAKPGPGFRLVLGGLSDGAPAYARTGWKRYPANTYALQNSNLLAWTKAMLGRETRLQTPLDDLVGAPAQITLTQRVGDNGKNYIYISGLAAVCEEDLDRVPAMDAIYPTYRALADAATAASPAPQARTASKPAAPTPAPEPDDIPF